MPDWLRDVLIALGAFVGGRAVNGIGEQMKEGRELRRGVDRLTNAVENIGADLRSMKVEIHDQVGALRSELHAHQVQQEARLNGIEDRIELTSGRIDALSTGAGLLTGPMTRARLRLNQEMGCYHPAGEGDQDARET